MSRTFRESDVVRDDQGQFAEEHGSAGKAAAKADSFIERVAGSLGGRRGTARGSMRPATDEERAAFRKTTGVALPRGLTDVEIADPLDGSPVLARGKDSKGRTKTIYSSEHTSGQAAAKFARVQQLNAHLDALDGKVEADALDNDSAAALLLIRRLGLRPGSDRDTKAEQAAFGATNLRAKHVTVTGDRVRFDFIGKNGVRITQSVKDPLIAQVMAARLAGKRGNTRLFDTSESKTRAYMRSTGVPAGFHLKDLRTVKANVIALQEVMRPRRPKAPRTKAEFTRWRNEVADKVAAQLGNTRAMALSAYVNPSAFGPWLKDPAWLT